MTQEDKELLLKDLCARLPYGVKFVCNKNVYITKGLDLIVTDEGDWEYAVTAEGIAPIEIDFIKPYLFPLSSMTVEQMCKAQNLLPDNCEISFKSQKITFYNEGNIQLEQLEKIFNFFNLYHFDYRDLISKNLAVDATGLNVY